MSTLLRTSLPLALALAACSDVGVTAINPPDAPTIALAPDAPITTDRLQAEVVAMPDQQGVRLTWAWFRDGRLVEELTSDTVPADLTAKGELWQVVATPWAGNLEGTPGTAEIEIGNAPPTTAAEIAPARPTAHDELVVTAEGFDADLDAVTLRYLWSRDGQETEHVGEVLPAGVTARGEIWSVAVIGNDGEADGPPTVAQVEITNAQPTLASVVLGPDPARTETPIRATVSDVQDIDGDPVELTYAFLVDGVVVQGGPSPDLAPSFYVKGQRVAVDVTPRDGFEDGPTVRSDELVIANTPPTATGAEISPDQVFTLTEPICRGLGFADVDGDAAGFEYRWTVNGAEAGTGPTLVSSAFARGDVLVCHASPFDGDDRGAEVASEPVTVLNTPPSIDTVSLSPEAPRVTDTITVAIGGATDADGDAITYRYAWTVNGVAIGHTGATLEGSFFRKGQRIAVTVTPNDGRDDGTAVTSDAVVAINAPPVVDSVVLSPDPAFTLDAVTASPAASDPDGDALTYSYTWYVDGTASSEVSSRLGPDNFEKHQDVYVSVVANDGSDDSEATVSPTLSISNSLPTAPEVAIDPAEPIEDEDLLCEIIAESTDDDGDALTYHVTWELDGEAYEGETETTVHDGDTIPWTDTLADDRWRCIAVANDGEGDGAEGRSDEVLVEPLSTCGDRVVDELEEYDPAPGPFSTVSVDSDTCRWDFSGVEQLYCNGSCSWAGSSSCDKADADVFCKLKMDNPSSTASSYRVTTALAKPGFPCAPLGYGTRITTKRGYSGTVTYQDSSILANHGAGSVVVDVVCTDP